MRCQLNICLLSAATRTTLFLPSGSIANSPGTNSTWIDSYGTNSSPKALPCLTQTQPTCPYPGSPVSIGLLPS